MPLGASSAPLSYFPTGLSKNGTLVLMAGIDKIEVSPMQLIATRRRIIGWPAGTGRDSQVRGLFFWWRVQGEACIFGEDDGRSDELIEG